MICGIDEAGRGPFAGPMVVAGVILNKKLDVDDSKKLSEKKREALYDLIINNSIYKIVFISNETIDKIGLSQSLINAISDIYNSIKAKRYIFDGNTNFNLPFLENEIKADSKYLCVSAASILAKVSRDRYMVEIAKKYPEYGFEKHKGYGTKFHKEMIKKYGLSPIHRKSYKIKL